MAATNRNIRPAVDPHADQTKPANLTGTRQGQHSLPINPWDVALLHRTQAYMAGNPDVSIEQLADEIGYSRSALSNYIRKVKDFNPDGVQRALRGWWAKQDRTAIDTFVPTTVSRRVAEACEEALANRDLVVIFSHPEMGKSTGVRRFMWQKRQQGERNFVYVTANPLTTHSALVQQIAEEIGMYSSFTAPKLVRLIVDALKRSPHLIVIDDASFLSLTALETLRYIHEQAGCGLVLIGTRALMLRMLGATGRMLDDLAQFYSRVGRRVSLPDWLPREEMAAMARAYSPEITDTELQAVLAKKRRPRGLVKLLRRIQATRAIPQEAGTTFVDIVRVCEQEIFEAA